MKFFRSAVKKLIKSLIILGVWLLIIQMIIQNATPIKLNEEGIQEEIKAYANIVEFQKARWSEIQDSVFGAGVAQSFFDSSLAGATIVDGNPYFTWKDTSSLGISPWDGTKNDENGTEITWEHFAGTGKTVTDLPTTLLSYTDQYEDPVQSTMVEVSNQINFYNVDIYTAEELRWVLETIGSTSGYNLKINIKNDIDLNGQQSMVWRSINLSGNNCIYIEGNGHTIYNIRNCGNDYTTGRGFLGVIASSLIMKNLNFESIMTITTTGNIGSVIGVINNTTSMGVYLENVKTKKAFMQSTGDNVGGFIGRVNGVTRRSVFIRNCSSEQSYICGTSHIGGLTACQHNTGTNYKVKYNAKFPEQPEAFLNTLVYSEVIENCYSVDCEVFSTDGDSGGFISCGGKFIARNCFTNNTIYANTKTGVFIGREVSKDSGSNGLYDDAGVKSINSYYENCYTSGIIEGKEAIGGFMGYMNSNSSTSQAVFKNCYSTSMVGMEYSGNNVGGFIGHDQSKGTLATTLNINGELKTYTGLVAINCYAAGEVGDISTNTENGTENTTTIGGFVGAYENYQTNTINCYYDKQTTGMRERGVGYVSSNATGSIPGLTGVYTKGSKLSGGTSGLTGSSGNIVNMGDSSAWIQKDGLYPQLKAFADGTGGNNSELIKCYSQASVSTVFLENWDYIMTDDNQTYNIQTEEPHTPTAKAEENNYIYDTIRDITLKFEFSSNENSEHTYDNIIWKVDSEMNRSRGFIDDYTIDYDEANVLGENSYNADVLTILNPAKNSGNIDPELLKLMESLGDTKDIYKCYEFAPGKSWVKVEVKNNSGTVVGTRKLRLLPMAYVDAGNYAEINIDQDGNNKIIYKSSDNVEYTYDGETYKHELDTLYTNTSRENLGNSENYQSQEVSQSKDTKFAMWGRYPASENKLEDSSRFDALYNQQMIGGATEGLTKVEVYKLDVEYIETLLSNGQIAQVPRINYDNATRVTEENLDNEKWTGMVNFSLEDTGWYELRYYWRLNDGRYLSDSKIVVIKGSTYTATIENKILNKDVETMPEIMPDVKEKIDDPSALNFDGTEVNETLGEDESIIRTKEIKGFTGEEVIMGWKNDGNYKLVDVQIEVSQDGTNWIPLTLELNNPDNPYDFINAKYTYYYQDYKMLQNPSTKEYYLMEIDEPKEITTTITPIASGENDDYAKYLYLSFAIKEDDESIKSVKSDVRVSATFVPMDTHVTAEKYVDKENVLTGEEVTYTVFLTPDYYKDAFDINASDVIPVYTEYVEGSMEVGEYDDATQSFIPDTEGTYSTSSYSSENNELTWHYDQMVYGKKYYAKFRVKVTGEVDEDTQDFLKVDNIVNFTYRKSEFGKPVDGEPSEAASFIVIQENKVYLLIEKEVTTPNAPIGTFKMNAEINKSGEDMQKYKWYINYENYSENVSSVEITQEQTAMLVGKVEGEYGLDGATYKINEDLNNMPSNYYFSSITDNGEGTLEAGKLKKVTVKNYYKAPSEQINVFIEKKDLDTDEYVSLAKMKLQKENEADEYSDYLNWQTGISHKTFSLGEGKYKVTEEESPSGYQLNTESVYFEVIKNDDGNLVVTNEEGEVITDKKVTFYNEQIKYKYSVEYYYENIKDDLETETNESLLGSIINDYTEKEKEGYIFDKTENLPLTVTEDESNNVVKVYYVKRNDLNYTVNYLEKDTNKVLSTAKEVKDVTFESEINAIDEIITIEGYNYDSADNEKIIIGVDENVINLYYTKRTNLSYTVNYLEKNTDKVISTAKVVNDVVFETKVSSADEVITIEGYDYDSADKDELIIGVNENVINLYYTKRSDLSYTVNYLEKNTDKVLSTAKVVNDVTFESEINSENEVITIEGYNYDSADNEKIIIGIDENIINLYYTKRTNLSYTVNYLEKNTDKVLSTAKVVNDVVFETEVNSEDEVITIEGYDYDSADKDELIIGVDENVINLYYTKRTDLSYTVNYLEKDTNIVLSTAKIVNNATFETEVKAEDEIINIDGYNYDSADKEILTIGVGENIISLYYTKRTDLSYTVNYLEKGTSKVLSTAKVVNDVIFGTEISSITEIITIEGYDYDSADKDELIIGVDENVINLYYTKRTDLSYTVNYLEKDTNIVLSTAKIVNNVTFETEVKAEDEVININGYNYNSTDKEKLIIAVGENIINLYYTKQTGLSYIVSYLEKDSDKILEEAKTVSGQTFGNEIDTSTEVIEIDGYVLDSINKSKLTIGTGENIINIYYRKRTDLNYKVNYLELGTNKKLHNSKVIENKEFEEVISPLDEVIEIYGYNFNKADKELLTITTGENIINLYYSKKDTKVVVHHYLENTETSLAPDVIIEGKVFDSYETSSVTDIDKKYELVGIPENATGTMSEETIEVIYYYKVKKSSIIVKFLEKETNKELSEQTVIDGKVDEEYKTESKEIQNYTLVEDSGNTTGTFKIESTTVIYYYLQNTKVAVNHIDKNSGKILDTLEQKGLVGDEYTSVSKDFENYVLIESPEKETVTMAKTEIVLNYYYVHVSAGVIEKHVNTITGEILYNETHEGNEGDNYDIQSKTFEGYVLDKEKLPTNSQGTMKIETIEVIYYYKYCSKVIIQHIDKNTNKKLVEDETKNGYEKDEYKTESKDFENYKLVEIPENAEGEMTKETITVTYYYVHKSAGVVENHYDSVTGIKLTEEILHEGYEGDEYKTTEKFFEGYDLVKEKYPTNSEGKMAKEQIYVDYYYVKKTKVTVKYIDKFTGLEVAVNTIIGGHEGDKYFTTEKTVPGYKMVQEPSNKNGTMTINPEVEVRYYYVREAKVIVNYVDIDTNALLAKEEINGYQNDSYSTEEKDIKYYSLVEIPVNKEGTMTVDVTKDENGTEIVSDTTFVTYYYRKLVFNLKVNKIIESIVVNGKTEMINGDLAKIELLADEVENAKVQVNYKITITNDGELIGKAKLLELIPNGMIMKSENNPEWTVEDNEATINIPELKPGENVEFRVVLDWNNSEGIMGLQENIAEIINVENEAGFEELNEADNIDNAKVSLIIETGKTTYIFIVGAMVIVLCGIAVIVYKKIKNN